MKTDSGKAGEDHIARWLEKRGYHILARNYHSRFGEIDIIAQQGPYLAFVEVKAREETVWFPLLNPLPRKSSGRSSLQQRHICNATLVTFNRGLTPQPYI